MFLSFVLFWSCQAPIAYVNSLPGSSQLKQKGDLNAKANLGADWRISDRIYDFDLAWSPINKVGIRTHITTIGIHKNPESYFEKLLYKDFALVYYDKKSKNLGYELIIGIGNERTESEPIQFSTGRNPDFFVPTVPISEYASLNQSTKFYFQPSISFSVPQEKNLEIIVGLKNQFVNHHQLYYQVGREVLFNGAFKELTFDPFIESVFSKGYFGLNSKIGYTIHTSNHGSLNHPIHKRLYYSIGVFINLKKRESGI